MNGPLRSLASLSPLAFCFACAAAPSVVAVAADADCDRRITERVERELRREPRLEKAKLEVRTVDGEVTIRGAVDTSLEKLLAQQACRRVKGIRSVSNQLEVAPEPPVEMDTASAIVYRWRGDPLLRSQEGLTAVVQGPVVTLRGVVATAVQRQHAERLARDIPGAVLVRNQLQIQTPAVGPGVQSADPADVLLRNRVVQMLGSDESLSLREVQVSVSGGAVTLRGVVSDTRQRDLLAQRVKAIPEVKRLDNWLVVVEQTANDSK